MYILGYCSFCGSPNKPRCPFLPGRVQGGWGWTLAVPGTVWGTWKQAQERVCLRWIIVSVSKF